MTFYSEQPGKDTSVPAVEEPKLYAEEYRNALVTSRYRNSTSLLSNVSGTPVAVNYYRQHLGKDESPVGLQLDDIATYQSYQRINKLIMKFVGAPSFTFDEVQGTSTENGTAYVLFDLTPIIGDMFVRDIGDGRAGLFQLTAAAEQTSYSADKVFLVTFKLLNIVSQFIQDNLDSKVVKELYYSKDSALSGGNAVITAENYNAVRELITFIPIIIRRLFDEAYFNPEETFVFVDEETKYLSYDTQWVKFLSRIIPLEALAGLGPINLINTQGGSSWNYTEPLTVWDALLRGSTDVLNSAVKTFYRYNRRQFFTTRYYGGANFTKIDQFIMPTKMGYNGLGLNSMYGDAQSIFPKVEPMTEEKGYFSDNFYLGSPSNAFEKLTYDFCFNNIRNRQELLTYCKTFYQLSKRDALYQGGVLIMMIVLSRRVLIGD